MRASIQSWQKRKIAFHIIFWLVVLFYGLWMVDVVFRSTCQGGTGDGVGFFDHSFRYYSLPDVEGDPSIAYIELEGQAPKRFMFDGGVSPAYDKVTMKWCLHDGYVGRPKGELSLNLANQTIDHEGRSVPLDNDHLLKVMQIPDRTENRVTLGLLLDALKVCHAGQLPKPSHFSREIKDPMQGNIQHGAHGYSVSYSTLTWIGIWMLMIIVYYTRKRIFRSNC